MLKAAIWDRFANIAYLQEKLSILRPEIDLLYMWVDDQCFVQNTKEGLLCVSYEMLIGLWGTGAIDMVILSAEKGDPTLSNNIWGRADKLQADGVTGVYVVPSTLERMPVSKMEESDRQNIIVHYKQFTELVVVKWLLFEGCNLNCSGCTHFSPLNRHPKMLSVGEFCRDLYMIKKKFHYMKEIQFLGGEPLMNKELDKFIIKAREIFPYCNLSIITNGILIPALSGQILKAIKENNVFVHISCYESTASLMDKIKDRLDEYQIGYHITVYIEKFRIQYNTSGKGDAKKNWSVCNDHLCHTMVDGKLSGCYYAGTVKHANEYFGLNIPHSEYEYDIYEKDLEAVEIIEKITSPTPLCSYCNGGRSTKAPFVPWRRSGTKKLVTDWFTN